MFDAEDSREVSRWISFVQRRNSTISTGMDSQRFSSMDEFFDWSILRVSIEVRSSNVSLCGWACELCSWRISLRIPRSSRWSAIESFFTSSLLLDRSSNTSCDHSIEFLQSQCSTVHFDVHRYRIPPLRWSIFSSSHWTHDFLKYDPEQLVFFFISLCLLA